MADDKKVISYGIDVKTGQSGDEVEALAKSLDGMRQAMKTANQEIAEMTKAHRNLKQGGDAFKNEAAAMKAALDERKSFVAKMQTEYTKLGGGAPKPRKPPGDPKELSRFQQAMSAVKDTVMKSDTAFGRLAGRVLDFTGKLNGAKIRAVGMTIALVSLVGVMAMYAKRLAETAVASQDARRNELLHFEALTRQRQLYTRTAGNAKEMQAAVDRISASVSISRGEVAQLGTQLYNAGARGKTFDRILEASAIKASALGMAAGSAFAGFANDIRRAGGSAARAAQDVKNRFGDVVQAKMKSLEVQTLKAKEGIASLFTGIDIEPILDANKAWNDMFSVQTETGKALRSFATAFLQPIVGVVETLWVVTRRFFKQMIIGALELGILYRQFKLMFIRTFGGPDVQSVWGKLFTALQPGRLLVYGLAIAFGVLAVNVIAATWPFLLAAAAVWGLFTIIDSLYQLWNEIDWSSLGKAVWEGIVNGLKKGWTAIKTVAGDLASELQKSFKLALGIQSPSKVFAELGVQIPRGVKQGIDSGAPEANAAARGLVDPPPSPKAIGAGAAGSGGGARVTMTIGTIPITVGGEVKESTARDLAQALRRELETVLAGLAEQIGAAREGGA